MSVVVPVGALLIGLVLLGAGVFTFFQQRAKIAQSLRAEGVVTELIGVRAGRALVAARTDEGVKIDSKYRYRPQVRFRTESGRTIIFVARIASRPARYKVGERVSVLYDPHNPSQAQINGFLDLWFQTLMLIFWGMFSIAMGSLGWVMSVI